MRGRHRHESGSLIDSPKPELGGKSKGHLRGKDNENDVLAGLDPEIFHSATQCFLALPANRD
jgi:hypothetical protein